MRTKRLVLACIVLVLLAGSLTLSRATPPSPGINRGSFEAIRVGMTQQEVESLLGGPAGDYSWTAIPSWQSFKTREDLPLTPEYLHSRAVQCQTWFGDDDIIQVGFDWQGVVVCKERVPVLHRNGTFGDTLRRWLGQ